MAETASPSAAEHAAVGLCLEIHDLVISKYVAGREKDMEFARAVISHGLVAQDTLQSRLEATPIDDLPHEGDDLRHSSPEEFLDVSVTEARNLWDGWAEFVIFNL